MHFRTSKLGYQANFTTSYIEGEEILRAGHQSAHQLEFLRFESADYSSRSENDKIHFRKTIQCESKVPKRDFIWGKKLSNPGMVASSKLCTKEMSETKKNLIFFQGQGRGATHYPGPRGLSGARGPTSSSVYPVSSIVYVNTEQNEEKYIKLQLTIRNIKASCIQKYYIY